MRNTGQERTNFRAIMFLSFVFGVIYVIGHIGEVADVMMMYVSDNSTTYLNIENFAYCILGILRVVFPVLIIYPHKNQELRVKIVKTFCFVAAGAYLCANFWIFRWLLSSVGAEGWTWDVAQYQKEACVMFNHLEWTSRNAETIFYNYVSAVLWYGVGHNLNRDRRLACKYMIISLVVRYLVPVMFYYFYRGVSVPEWWLKKMLPILCSEGLFALGLIYASRNRTFWKYHVCHLKYKKKKSVSSEKKEEADKQEEKNGL